MPSEISHEEIVKHFVASKAVDFGALGKFITDNGLAIAVANRGDYGVRIGHYNILACFNIGPRVTAPFEQVGNGFANEVLRG